MSRFAARLASLCFYCLIGCGTRALALDHAAPAESATTDAEDPFVSTGSVSGVWIDEQRLYWLASESSLSVQSCRTPDCERTTLSYARSQQLVSVAVADGRVYWTSGSSLFSCTAEGCQGKPLRLAEDPAVYGRAIFARRDYIYWSSDFDIYRCPAQGCRHRRSAAWPAGLLCLK